MESWLLFWKLRKVFLNAWTQMMFWRRLKRKRKAILCFNFPFNFYDFLFPINENDFVILKFFFLNNNTLYCYALSSPSLVYSCKLRTKKKDANYFLSLIHI